MTLTVHHYFPLGSDNVGDALVAHAIRCAALRHFGPARFVDMPVNDRLQGHDRCIGLRGDNLRRSNDEADLIIVGGSNLLEPRKPKRGLWPGQDNWLWGVFTDEASLRSIRRPLLLLGMGTGSSFGKPVRAYPEAAQREIRLLHQRAFAAAVRDVTTAKQLASIGVDAACTGCPVTFLTNREICSHASDGPLIVSFPPSRIVRRRRGKAFMRGAMRYIERLRDAGVPLLVTLHETRDLEIADDWVPKGVPVFHTEDVDELIARYETCRGVIGFRLHAALLALGLGKPIVPVGVDWRGRGFIDTFALRDVAIRPGRLGQFRKLDRQTARLLQGEPAFYERLRREKARFLGRFDRFLREAAERFRSLVPIAGTDGRAVGSKGETRRAG